MAAAGVVHSALSEALSGPDGVNSLAESGQGVSHNSEGHSPRAARSQHSAAVSYEGVLAAGSAAFSSRSLEGESALSAAEPNVEECSVSPAPGRPGRSLRRPRPHPRSAQPMRPANSTASGTAAAHSAPMHEAHNGVLPRRSAQHETAHERVCAGGDAGPSQPLPADRRDSSTLPQAFQRDVASPRSPPMPSVSRGSFLEARCDSPPGQQQRQPSVQSGRNMSVNGQHQGQSSAPSNIGLDLEVSGERGGGHTISQRTPGDENNQEAEADVQHPGALSEPVQSTCGQAGGDVRGMATAQAQLEPTVGSGSEIVNKAATQDGSAAEPPCSTIASPGAALGAGRNSPSVSAGILTPANSVARSKRVPSEAGASGPLDAAGTSAASALRNGVVNLNGPPQNLAPTVPIVDLGAQPCFRHPVGSAVQQACSAFLAEGSTYISPVPLMDINTLHQQLQLAIHSYVAGIPSSTAMQQGQDSRPGAQGVCRPPEWSPHRQLEQAGQQGHSARHSGPDPREEPRPGHRKLVASASEGNAVQDTSVHATVLVDDALSDAETNLSLLRANASQRPASVVDAQRHHHSLQSDPRVESMPAPQPALTIVTGVDSGCASRALQPANSTLARNSDQSNTSGGGTVNMSRSDEEAGGVPDLKDTACSERSSHSEENSESPNSVAQKDGSFQSPAPPDGGANSGLHKSQGTGCESSELGFSDRLHEHALAMSNHRQPENHEDDVGDTVSHTARTRVRKRRGSSLSVSRSSKCRRGS